MEGKKAPMLKAAMLSALQAMNDEEWRSLVAWAAPMLADGDPDFLLEILDERHKQRFKDMSLAELMSSVGLRVVLK